MVADKGCRVKRIINISTDLHGYVLPPGLRHFSLYFNALALFCYDLAGEVEPSVLSHKYDRGSVKTMECITCCFRIPFDSPRRGNYSNLFVRQHTSDRVKEVCCQLREPFDSSSQASFSLSDTSESNSLIFSTESESGAVSPPNSTRTLNRRLLPTAALAMSGTCSARS